MALAGRARRALGDAVRWERRTIGVTELVPPRVRGKLRRLLGMGSLQDARRYAPAGGLEELFDTLHRRNASYVVIRWFESLPGSADGDIDFLVADDALATFEELLDADAGGVPCDLYSATGVRGYRYAGMSYYPSLLAQRILARRTSAAGKVSVPCPEDHFFSLAYHALYQKGLRSGLPTSLSLQPEAAPLHDYEGTLKNLATALQLPVELSMEGLEAFLASRGWRPPAAMLKRLARQNKWVRMYFFDRRLFAPSPDDQGLFVDG